jgi:hypothetical protein
VVLVVFRRRPSSDDFSAEPDRRFSLRSSTTLTSTTISDRNSPKCVCFIYNVEFDLVFRKVFVEYFTANCSFQLLQLLIANFPLSLLHFFVLIYLFSLFLSFSLIRQLKQYLSIIKIISTGHRLEPQCAEEENKLTIYFQKIFLTSSFHHFRTNFPL